MWNSIEGEHTPFDDPQIIYELVDLQGNPTGVTLHQFGGLELIAADDPSIDGNDAILLNDALVTHSANLESCLFINGLESGTYEVLTYAWMPNHPETLARVRHDFTPGTVDVGGAWTGEHVEGTTYARHIVDVPAMFMGSHSGNVPGGNLKIGAALNGIQLRKIEPCLWDLDDNNDTGVGDLLILLGAWGTNPGHPADFDGNDDVGVSDLLVLLANWGPCP